MDGGVRGNEIYESPTIRTGRNVAGTNARSRGRSVARRPKEVEAPEEQFLGSEFRKVLQRDEAVLYKIAPSSSSPSRTKER